MTSERRRIANQTNAKASTGPMTSSGKARSAKNALRHGLNIPVWSDPALAPQAEAIALRIAGPNADAETLECARQVSEAQVDLNRVRASRRTLIARLFADPEFQPLWVGKMQRRFKGTMEIIEQIGRAPPEFAGLMKILYPEPLIGDDKLAAILEDRGLATLDRYERRALSRRKFAIRDFDAARALAITVPRPREN